MWDKWWADAFKYWEKYPQSSKKRALTYDNISRLSGWWVDGCVLIDPASGLFQYKDIDKLRVRYTSECAVAMYLLSFRMQGLAFADMARIKALDVLNVKVDGVEYYKILNVRRSKTGRCVPILLEKDGITMALLEGFLMYAEKDRDGWLFPVLKSYERDYAYSTDKAMSEGLMLAERIVNKKLQKVCALLNEGVIDNRLPEDITFYSARHTFATLYMRTEGANPIHLATMMGRSVSGIHCYIAELEKDSDIATERGRLFDVKK